MSLRVVFAGTPAFSVPVLQALLSSDHEVVAVYTQPDRPAGRGRQLVHTPVKALALSQGVPVYQPASFKEAGSVSALSDLSPDVLVVVAYGLLLPRSVLDIPRWGGLNVHASLLPRWRGASPIHSAILSGDRSTGVSIMQMDEGLDTGPVWAKTTCVITQEDTTETLMARLSTMGADLLMHTLDHQLRSDQARATPQASKETTYAPKIKKSDAELDWNQSACTLSQAIRAYQPWPIAYATCFGERIRVWSSELCTEPHEAPVGTLVSASAKGLSVVCGTGVLRLTRLQAAGGRVMDAQDFLNARRDLWVVGQCVMEDAT